MSGGQRAAAVKHLWEHGHPYMCEPGNFYERGLASHYGSWAEFAVPSSFDRVDGQMVMDGTALYDGDPDQNLLFRWDWRAMHLEFQEVYPDEERHVLYLFFMMQRKGYNQSVEIDVTAEDEPAVRVWLAERHRTIRAMWAPFSG